MAEDKKKAKARIIQEYLPRCSRYKCYTQGEIPMSKFEKARESYASGVSYRDVLGMIDESFLETAVRDSCLRKRDTIQRVQMAASATVIIHSMVIFWVIIHLFLMRCWTSCIK